MIFFFHCILRHIWIGGTESMDFFIIFFIGAGILILLILGIVLSHKYAIYEPTEAFANKEIDILLIVYRILRN